MLSACPLPNRALHILHTTCYGFLTVCRKPKIRSSGANRALGVSDRVFAVLDSSLLRCLGELAQMPLLVLAARLCPPGLEATLFAALMSLLNGAWNGVGNGCVNVVCPCSL